MSVHICISLIFLLFAIPSSTWALDCKPLVPSQQLNKEMEAKLEVDTGKLLKRLLGGAEASYRQLTQDTLKDYPEADRLVVCERMIYLSCTLLENTKEPLTKQVEVVDGLMRNCSTYRLDAVRSDKKPNYSKKVEGFQFDLHSCSMPNGKDACCDLHITSEGRDRQIGIGYSPRKPNITRAYDDAGNVYQATTIQVGEYDQHKYYVQSMPGDIPVASKVCFANISTKASQFRLVDLIFVNLENNKNGQARFHAVPLPR
jgi:hypothetical protein